MKPKLIILPLFLVLALMLGGSRFASGARGAPLAAVPGAPDAPLPKPEDIACQGWERDTIIVSWKDTATDENGYKVERSIGGAAFTEVANLTPNADGGYDAYKDLGADVSTQNRRYRVRSYRTADSATSPYSDVCNNRRIFDPGAFRLFFGLRGTADDCPLIGGNQACLTNTNGGDGNNVFVTLQNNALNGSVAAFARAGFTRSASAPPSGLDKIPVNVVWCDGGGCAGSGSLGLSPFLMETPFNMATRVGDPVAWMVAVHELFHFQQFKYSGLSDPAGQWVVEGQARSIQDKFCIGDDRSTAPCFDDIETGYAGYVPQVKGYLGNPNWPINQQSYSAALFWTYLTEKFGTSAPGDTVEGGMDILRRFWEASAATPGRDGISIVNGVLSDMGYTQRFRDIWKDFAVANYAKDLSGPGVQAKYRYADMSQPGGNYGPVALALSQNLNLGDSLVNPDNTVYPWGANYYELRPTSSVPFIDIKITQDSSANVYYTILGIRGNDVKYEYNTEARNLSRTVINDNYDKVAVIVVGLENLANYRYSFNGTQPTLRILSPTTANKARVGDPTAPDKFLITVEVIAGDGTPLAGVDLNNFSFKVGTVGLPAANLLTSANVMSQQWFLVRAPVQVSAGMYDLQVRYGTILTGTQSLAVNYVPRTDIDNVLVVDRSGSMATNGKLDAAKTAARLFVDSWRTGDQIGVITFNQTPVTDMTLRNWTDSPSGGSRGTAFTAINNMVAGGATAIGDALRKGWNELNTNGNSAHDWALVLLSDGKEEGTVTETFDSLIDALSGATTKRPVVHTVAVGPDADRLRMQRLSNATGGTYQYVSTPSAAMVTMNGPTAISNLFLNMDSRYRMIATKIAGEQQFFNLNGPIADGNPDSDSVIIPVEGSASEMVLSLSWDPNGCCVGNVALYDPAQKFVSPFEQDSRHIVWRVPTPVNGNWNMVITTVIIGKPSETTSPNSEFLPNYLVQGALRSQVTMDAYLTTPDSDRKPGAPMGILATLTDTGPITGATIVAYVEKPLGGIVAVLLHDDGNHDDGAANDGLYGGTFYQTGQPGDYNVTVNANGSSPLSGPFFRQEIVSFHLDSAGDKDQDGLPDEWEIHFGTNPNVPDQNADPDNDGLPNVTEWQKGTNPNDPDTDHGGEADNTDPNPLDPSDDGIKPTWGVAYPGDSKIFIKYVLRPEYKFVALFRGSNPHGPFQFLMQNTPGNGLFTDTNVTNGTEYCYQVLALDAQNSRSAGLMPTCATPKSDPLPPHGGITINGGASSTIVPLVTLNLWASDSVDPETVIPGDEVLQPAGDSASGVTEMMISNHANMEGGVWEPYATTKSWNLGQSTGLAAVFVKYRDAASNESLVYPATIHIGSGPGIMNIFLPAISKH